jgi:peptidoglycan-associated lipoprotein
MKLNKFSFLLALGTAAAFTITGCKPHPYVTPLPSGGGSRTGGNPPVGIGDGVGIGAGPGAGASSELAPPGGEIAANPAGSHLGWVEDTATLKADVVYFDYDKSAIRPSEEPKVAAVADYLKSNPACAVRVEGNCDETGTAEYNRSLGERRALAVREKLAQIGIDPARVDTISYGFDRPAVPGHDEVSRTKNRRDEFVVLTPPLH